MNFSSRYSPSQLIIKALTVFEDYVSESKAQFNAMTNIIIRLSQTTCFGFENYETLVTKCAVHSARLLKRVDQCRGVTLCSHLFYRVDDLLLTHERQEGTVGGVYKDSKRVLECLQKALKIADSVMDRNTSISLFVEILEQYLWYFDRQCDSVK